jgi:hypothetical protein
MRIRDPKAFWPWIRNPGWKKIRVKICVMTLTCWELICCPGWGGNSYFRSDPSLSSSPAHIAHMGVQGGIYPPVEARDRSYHFTLYYDQYEVPGLCSKIFHCNWPQEQCTLWDRSTVVMKKGVPFYLKQHGRSAVTTKLKKPMSDGSPDQPL